MESCGTSCFERARSAVAVLEKLEVSNLISLEARQETKRRCDFSPGHIRFVGKRAKEGDTVTLLYRVRDSEVEGFPEASDRCKDLGQRLRPPL